MPKIKVEMKGWDKLEKQLKDNCKMRDVARVVKHNGAELTRKMMREAEFKGHYEWEKGTGEVWKEPTGATKDSIRGEIQDGGFTAVVEPGTHYSPYLEYGTRFMDAQPFVRPAYNEQVVKFKSDMKKLVR